MDNLIDFFSFSDPNVRYVVIGSVLLAASSAIVGSFTFLKKRALVGDAVAHSVLPGVCLGFLLSGTKNPIYLVIGAFITGWLSLILIDWVVAKSKIKEDTAIGLMLSVFFGFGILLLTAIQHSGNASQSGLDHFLFGKAASLVGEDLWIFSSISGLLILSVYLFFKEFTLIAFDVNFAKAIGFPVKGLELALTTLTVLAVVIGIQAVGVVLMAAMLITPAAAARFWTDKLRVMIVIAAIFGAFSGIAGAYISYIAPSMPTGPWIVMVLSLIAMFSFFFAPKKGILYRMNLQRRNRILILEENILKTLYHLGEKNKDFTQAWSIEDIQTKRMIPTERLKTGLHRLAKKGLVFKINDSWTFTSGGLKRGKRVVRLHRLWELYLTEKVNIAADHVHEDAETIEHIITPEVERMLSEKLGFPKSDPHKSDIPYD